jgi:cytochrome c-type biogenesis protein CcmH
VNTLATGFRALAAAGALLLLGLGQPAQAEGWGYALANEIMSPFCPGRALAEGPSPQAEDLRRWILEQEAAGVSQEAVEAELYAAWGDELRQSPRASGVGLLAYAIPAVAFVVGGGVLLVLLRRKQKPAEEGAATPALDPDLERLLEEELSQR